MIKHTAQGTLLVSQQNKIGWTGLFTRIISKEWHHIQSKHLRDSPPIIPAGPNERPYKRPKTTQHWIATLIERCQREWKKLWHLRNTAQHGTPDDPQSRAIAKRRHVLQEIRKVTDIHEYLPPLYQDIIDVHTTHQQDMTTSALDYWLAT